MRILFNRWYIMASFLPFSGTILFGASSELMYLFQFAFATMGFLHCLLRAKENGKLKLHVYFIFLSVFIGLMFYSAGFNGNLTFGILFGGYVVLGMMLYYSACIDQVPAFFTIVRNYFTVLIAVNAAVFLLKPPFSMQMVYGEGACFVGIFVTKNRVQLLLMPALFFIFSEKLMYGKRISAKDYVPVVLGLIFMQLSKSSTAIVISSIALLLILLSQRIIISPLKMYGFYVVSSILVVFARIQDKLFYDVIVNVLHKDITLTGRTNIWDAVFEHVEQHPILGLGPGNDLIASNFTVNGRPLEEAHNALVQVLLNCGNSGLIITLLLICYGFWCLKRCPSKKTANVVSVFLLSYLMLGFTESVITFSSMFFWLLMLVAVKTEAVVRRNQEMKCMEHGSAQKRIHIADREDAAWA